MYKAANYPTNRGLFMSDKKLKVIPSLPELKAIKEKRADVVVHSVGLGLRGDIIIPKAGVVNEVDRSQLSFLETLGL